jgi:(S)-2-hydroxy-acid oxidase
LLAALPALARARVAVASPPAGPGDLLNVMDFEAAARAILPAAHFGYLATGTDDDRTVAWNHDAFGLWEIRARRLVDVSHLDTSIELFGTRWPSPVYLSAVSSQGAFHPDGEVGVARAAASRSTLLMLSGFASRSLQEVAQARAAPVWQQIYATSEWQATAELVARAELAGCPAIVLTVDNMPGRNNETLLRAMRADSRTCTDCHLNNSHDALRKAPLYAGLGLPPSATHTPVDWNWDFVRRLRKVVSGRLLIKGIVTGEDAQACVDCGVDGVIVSNHGGRDEETLRSTLECLPEVVAAVRGRIPVLLDGGVRRGTDVFKALALGASAVGIGRPQGWGLAAFGQAGVERVLDIYERELQVIMRQAGTPTIAAITGASLAPRPVIGRG